MNISREQARLLLEKFVKTEWIKLHSRETEEIMRTLAKKLKKDEELWGITGLLHDLDMDLIDKENPKNHGSKTIEILKAEFGESIPKDMLEAIKAHCENLGFTNTKRKSDLDYALAAAENLSGFLVACALVQPDKKISSVKTESVIRKLKDKSFAAKVNRDFIYDISKIGTSLHEFITTGLQAFNKISKEIGL